MKLLITVCCCLAWTANVYAHCPGGPEHDINRAFSESDWVVLAEGLGERTVSSSDEPDSVLATIYTVKVLASLKGNKTSVLEIWSDNTDNRLIIKPHQRFLLYLQSGRDGFYIDYCGRSSALSERKMPQKSQRADATEYGFEKSARALAVAEYKKLTQNSMRRFSVYVIEDSDEAIAFALEGLDVPPRPGSELYVTVNRRSHAVSSRWGK